MGKTTASAFFKTVKATLSKHSPEILTGIGVMGMITTTVLAVKATPKALRLIEEKKQETKTEKIKPIDAVKTTWKCYLPATITGAASVTCLIGANSVHARRTAALAAAYQISETALTEYKAKVIETVGEKKEQIVREQIDKDRVEKNPVTKNEVIVTKKGNTLCFDTLSGRYFKSDMDRIKRAENELNKEMIQGITGSVSLNEFYDELGLEHIAVGDDIGWTLEKGLIDISFSSQLADDGTPCMVLDYRVVPRYGY